LDSFFNSDFDKLFKIANKNEKIENFEQMIIDDNDDLKSIEVDTESNKSMQETDSSCIIELSSDESMDIENVDNKFNSLSDIDENEQTEQIQQSCQIEKTEQTEQIEQININERGELNKDEEFINDDFHETSIDYTGFGNKKCMQPYFLKFSNNNNSCYANSLIGFRA
jgi:hypothetical protein